MQDERIFEHRQKHDDRILYGCALARFLNISVICFCSYVLDMFFNTLKYKLEPQNICVTLEKPNASLILMQDSRTASYGERGGSVVACRTPEREVGGSKPTAAVLCP